jgi:WhiB family redox-sensing transcriptional regulator
MHHWAEFVGQLGDVPQLPGARCRGRHELFDATINGTRGSDPGNVEYARSAAEQLCQACPALADCRRWLNSLTPHSRPAGITAGQLPT